MLTNPLVRASVSYLSLLVLSQNKFQFHPKVCDDCFNENHNHYYYKVFLTHFQINNMKMLYYDRINISEGIDINKTSTLKVCFIATISIF